MDVYPSIPPARAAAGLAGVFVLLFVLERVAPLRTRRRSIAGRLAINAAFSGLAFAVGWMVVRPAALAALQWTTETRFGLIHAIGLPPPAQFVLAFLLMDLTFYWWHLANHYVPFLWRFHNVHHVDQDLDVSTAFRFHFGEVALSTAFRAAQMAAIGPTLTMFVAYELVFQANTMFHHSNVRLPIGVERVLSLLLVAPRMHGIHHSQVREHTNSNFSVIFSWWDRLHRTLRLDVPQSAIVIGVPAYSNPEDNRFWNALCLPFRRQRPYWRKSVL